MDIWLISVHHKHLVMGSKPPEFSFSFFQVIFFFFPGYLFLFSRLSFSFFQVIFFFFPGSKPDIIIKTNKNKGFFLNFFQVGINI